MEHLLRKASKAVFTIFFALTAIFIGIRLAPGDPVERLLGPEASLEELQKYREQLGLHLSWGDQYVQYFKQLLSNEMGESIFKKTPIKELIKKSMGPSFLLATVSILFSSVLGIAGGVFSAQRRSKKTDTLFRAFSLLGLSFPVFSIAPMLVVLFSIKLNWFPVSEWGEFRHMVLPVMTLVIPLSSIVLRVTRNKYLEEHTAPWITVLMAKGLPPFSITWRILKVVMPTVLNVVALQLSVVLAGTMITETIFDIPGMGSLLFEGIQNRDYPLVQGVIIYVTVIYMFVYFLVDYLNEKIDPRIVE